MEQQIVDQAQQNNNNQVQVIIDSKTFGAKFTSKKECYRFLTHDCGAYLATY